MEWMIFISAFATILSAMVSAGSSEKTNATNVQLAEEANATNIQLAREANAAQAAESQKAYERSKATNQVNLMRAAGMSKAGALNALNGGGSYTPAPVNTAQVSAAQVDDTGMQNAANLLSSLGGQFSNAAQMKEQKRQFEEQLQEQKRANQANIDAAKADADLKQWNLFKEQNQGLVTSWIEEALTELTADGDVTNQNILNHITSRHKNDPAFSTMDKDNLSRFVGDYISQHNANEELARDTAEFEKILRKYDDDHSMSEAQVKTLNKQYERIKTEVEEFNSLDAKDVRRKELVVQSLELDLEEFLISAEIPEAESKAKYIAKYYSEGGTWKGKEYDEWTMKVNKWINEFPVISTILDAFSNGGSQALASLLAKRAPKVK